MRFLLTGATGFVGGAVARRLLGEGETVHVLVRDAAKAEPLARAGARPFTGTIGDPNEVAEAARGCDVVVHAAAVTSHRAAPRALRWVNIAGTENVLNAARHVGCRRLVYISCADVTLSNQDRVHWNEDRMLVGRPIDLHAQSKLLAEELALTAGAGGFETIALRPALLWGPGDTTLLPQLCREDRSGGVRLVAKGTNLVATTYIEHLVDAVAAASEVQEAAGNVYHVTDGEFIDAREFFGALCEAAGLKPPRTGPAYGIAYALALLRKGLRTAGPWPTDVIRRGRSTFMDAQRAAAQLAVQPRIGLADGMAAVAAWVRETGGAAAVAELGRPPATDASVDAQVAAAGGDDP